MAAFIFTILFALCRIDSDFYLIIFCILIGFSIIGSVFLIGAHTLNART